MPRLHCTECGLETGMFSVHQMHPEAAARLALSTALGGIGKQHRGLQRMMIEHDTALVIIGMRVDYKRDLTFLTTPIITSQARVSLRDDGNLFVFEVEHLAAGAVAVTVDILLRPVMLTGGAALDAVPGPVGPQVRGWYEPDEILPRTSAPARQLRAEVSRLTADAKVVFQGDQSLFIGRSDCEFADQWLAPRVASLVASAREQLLLAGAEELSESAKRPVERCWVEFFRPMFFGDRGRVRVSAYRQGDQLVVVHHVLAAPVPGGDDVDGPLCALAVETF